MGANMHTIKESIAGAVLAGGAAGILWAVLSGDVEQGLRAGAVIAVLPLTLGAAVQLAVIVEAGRARAAHHWRAAGGPRGVEIVEPGQGRELPALRPADRRAEIVEPDRVRLIPVVSHAGAVLASEPASIVDDGREVARVVSVAKPERLIDGVNEKDLLSFVQGIELRGWARSGWAGRMMPSGRRVDSTYHSQLVACVEKCGGIVERKKGSAGRLALTPGEIVERLGLPADAVQVAEPA